MRLTNQIREDIAIKASCEKFDNLIKEKRNELNAAAEALYTLRYPPEIVAKMNRLPEIAFHQTSELRIKVAKYDHTTIHMSQSRRVFAYEQYSIKFDLDDQPEEVLAALKLHKELESLKDRKTNLRLELQRTMRAINTAKQLLEVWPEAEKYLSGITKQVTPNLPALPVGAFEALVKGA